MPTRTQSTGGPRVDRDGDGVDRGMCGRIGNQSEEAGVRERSERTGKLSASVPHAASERSEEAA